MDPTTPTPENMTETIIPHLTATTPIIKPHIIIIKIHLPIPKSPSTVSTPSQIIQCQHTVNLPRENNNTREGALVSHHHCQMQLHILIDIKCTQYRTCTFFTPSHPTASAFASLASPHSYEQHHPSHCYGATHSASKKKRAEPGHHTIFHVRKRQVMPYPSHHKALY